MSLAPSKADDSLHLRSTDLKEHLLTTETPTQECASNPPHVPQQPKVKSPVLHSTHLIFFKIADYVDITMANGAKNNFLFVFRNLEAFCDVGLAVAILIASVIVLGALVNESRRSCVDDDQPRYIWMGVILCALHTANTLTTCFLKALPYEVFGTSPEAAEKLIQKVNESKIEKKDLFSDKEYMNAENRTISDVESHRDPAEPDLGTSSPSAATVQDSFPSLNLPDAEHMLELAKVYSTAAVSTAYLYGVAFVLQLNNFLLLLAFGAILGTSTNFTDLVTHFVAIESITHVHEVVPAALKIKDRSPKRFNKSGIEVEEELEASGRLSYGLIVKPNKKGKGAVYRWSARMHKNTIFWSFFLAISILFFLVSESCRLHREVYG